ncbi:hypothetical protein [Parasitella parasitica]|uniref:protein S-acyltransferase n=1 Tax=Parasitella parasitica TaxID=35722 RepID=A0A0B7N535_9FUNG|nr:hypothetical protein [Parasitella parasitica]
MSERKTDSKVILPLPFLLDPSPTASTTELPRFGNRSTEPKSSDLSKTPVVYRQDQPQMGIPIAQKQPQPQPQLQQQQQQQQQQTEPKNMKHLVKQGKRQLKVRNYKQYGGKTVFFCGGRFMTSRALWAFCISLFLLIMPCVLFLIFTCPWLWHHISPAVPVIFAYIFCITFASMLKTSWTDPGILPRNLDLGSMNAYKDPDRFGHRYSSMSDGSFPSPREVMIKGVVVRLKYCETCCIYRPPRASHCKQCDNCLRSNLISMPFEEHPFSFGNPLKNMYHTLCRPRNKSYIARRKFAEEIYDIEPTMNATNPTATVADEPGQTASLNTNILLQITRQ